MEKPETAKPSQEPPPQPPVAAPKQAPPAAAARPEAKPAAAAVPEARSAAAMNPVRKWILVFCAFCLLLLVWYLIGDRFTPFTTQARVNAFVVSIAPQVQGNLLAVDVTNNQFVKKGQRLAQIDPEKYELAVASAEAQLALTLQNLKASTSAVNAASAAVASARANLVKQQQNAVRLRRIMKDDPGAISQRRLEQADASLEEAEASVAQARANLEKAIEVRGPRDDRNPQLLAARAALAQAKRDLRNTQILAPADGLVTDLAVDVGNFASTGQPLMTFVAIHSVWIQADLTENNLGHVKPGAPVDLVLDVWPGKVLRGKVRSIVWGVRGTESTSVPGRLPTVQNTRNWLRDAQRFPVLIDLENTEEAIKLGMRVGGQANVIVYSGDHAILNAMGRFVIHLSGFFSYVY